MSARGLDQIREAPKYSTVAAWPKKKHVLAIVILAMQLTMPATTYGQPSGPDGAATVLRCKKPTTEFIVLREINEALEGKRLETPESRALDVEWCTVKMLRGLVINNWSTIRSDGEVELIEIHLAANSENGCDTTRTASHMAFNECLHSTDGHQIPHRVPPNCISSRPGRLACGIGYAGAAIPSAVWIVLLIIGMAIVIVRLVSRKP